MKFYFKIFLLFFLLLCSILLTAQVNIEKQRKNIKKAFETSLGVSFDIYDGNTELLRYTVNLRLDYKKGENSGFLIGNLAYGEKNKISYINKGFAHIRFIRRLSDRYMLEVFAQNEFNEFILLKRRQLAGSGIRIKIIDIPGKKSDFELFTGIGLMYEKAVFDISSDGSKKDDTSLIKSSNYISFKYTSKRFSLANVTYFQPSFERDQSFRIYSDLQFSVKLSKILSYTAGLTYRYDTKPAPTVKHYDIQMSNGLKIIF